MIRILHQLPRAIRQQWNLSVRTSQAVHSEDDSLENARKYATLDNHPSESKECNNLFGLTSALIKKEQHQQNGDKQVQKCSLYNYYHRAYNQVPYSCREALGWGSALVVGLQLLHLWKSGWFRKRGYRNVEKDRDRECLVKSLYSLAMAMPQSSGLARYVINSSKNSPKKESNKTTQQVSENNTDLPSKTEDKVPNLEEAVESWRRFSDAYIALKITQEGVEIAKEGSFTKAIKMWERASKTGLDKAHYNLAVCYENGYGMEKNMQKAIEHYEMAAKKGHSQSLFNLAMFHLSGDGQLSQDKDYAVHLLQQAASKGLPLAQRELGVLYTEDEMKDMKRACELFEEAAAQEDLDALYYLGICYEQGWGTEQNECKAVEYCSKASRAGHHSAQFNLATLFEEGKGGLPEDKQAALELFQQALENGNPAAKEEICRLNSMLLNRKLGDEMDMSSGKALGLSLSQPSFIEDTNRNFSLFFDADTQPATDNTLYRSKGNPTEHNVELLTEKEASEPVKFYIGEGSDEGFGFNNENHNGNQGITSTWQGGRNYGHLHLALANQGYIDLDVIDTCKRSSSLNDLIYCSSGNLPLQQTNNGSPSSFRVKKLNEQQASGLVVCS